MQEQTGLTKRVNKYEDAQKLKLVELGQSTKPYKDILQYLDNEIKQSTKMANFRHEIFCFKSDGAYQLNRAIEKIYGVAQGKGDSQMSGGEANIETLDVKLADGTRVKVPYGTIAMPEAGEGASIDIKYDHAANKLHVTGSCQFRFASMIDEIVDEAKYLLNTDSIYKSQAIELDNKYEPAILDLTNIDNEFMVLSEKTVYEMKPLMSRVLHPEKCIAKNIPLKLGVLLEGDYG